MKKHIDDVQTPTVDEHFKLILEDYSINNPEMNVTSDDLPHWYNQKLHKEAQNYYNRNIMAINIVSLMGLITVFSVAQILKVLMFTKQSNTTCAAFKRYLKTVLHIHSIYTFDANNPDSNWYKSINVIRWKHNTNSQRSKKAGVGPIYQRDMALTQFSFVGYIFIMPEVFGLCSKPEEAEALNHFWRVIGYMLGIPDRLNICRKSAVETRELCQKIFKDVYIKCLSEASPDFFHIASTILNSLWYIDIHSDKDSILALIYRLHGIEYKKPLGWYSWLNMKYIDLLFKLCLIPYVGTVTRIYLNCSFRLKLFIVENYPILAWAKLGKKNIQINLYSKYE
ncbi:unnamed protein product [Lasius platythorax]|uniref:ER-bound oxygenase mpaB/mpaB'/Rubber oxygenase catalytic domain-containing protein n=1 Tax=Lasius platythorax TaxID=488582 RepID=A0AAV2P8D6_9HYME